MLHNKGGEITESTIANVLVQEEGVLYTPSVHCGLLAGTKRTALFAASTIKEHVITVAMLKNCEQLFLINSVRGIYPAIDR